MMWHMRSTLYPFSLLSAFLFLALLVTSCGFFSPQEATTTISPQQFTTYTGDGYSLGYPPGWTARRDNTMVIFSDPLGLNTLIIEFVANSHGELSVASAIDGGLSGFQSEAKNFQKVPITSTILVGGERWSQGAATGQTIYKGQNLSVKFVVLADSHQDDSPVAKTFVIIYGTEDKLFDDASRIIFSPMLQSFKFR